jgi:6-phosphogluconolactonase (cycloisomerase 2 family)
LYFATSDGSVYLDTIVGQGNLQPANQGAAVAQVSEPTWMSMDRSGKWLFVASAVAGNVTEFQIDGATGALHSVSSSIQLGAGHPKEILVTPDNQALFIALGKGGLDAFSFNASTGKVGTGQHLAPLHGGSSADNVLTSDNASRNLYVGEANAGIRVFSIGGGELQEIQGSPFGPAQQEPTAMVMDGSDSRLAVANASAKSMTQYSVAGDGSLAVLGHASAATDDSPAALTVDKSGTHVLSISSNGVPTLQHFSSQ